MIKNKFKRICLICGKEFMIWRYQLENTKFCSHKCGSIYKIGKPNTSNTKFFKGQKSWNKGKRMSPESIIKMKLSHIGKCIGEKNGMWKGDNATYGSIHDWVWRIKGIPKKCEHCGETFKQRRLNWANIDHKYRRVISDYISLCYSCHRKYDYFRITKPQTEYVT